MFDVPSTSTIAAAEPPASPRRLKIHAYAARIYHDDIAREVSLDTVATASSESRPTNCRAEHTTFTVTFQVTTSRNCRARERMLPSTLCPLYPNFLGRRTLPEIGIGLLGLGETARRAWPCARITPTTSLHSSVFNLTPPSIMQRRQFEKRSATVIRMRSRNSDNAANVRPPGAAAQAACRRCAGRCRAACWPLGENATIGASLWNLKKQGERHDSDSATPTADVVHSFDDFGHTVFCSHDGLHGQRRYAIHPVGRV